MEHVCNVRERPFDFYRRGGGGYFAPGYFLSSLAGAWLFIFLRGTVLDFFSG